MTSKIETIYADFRPGSQGFVAAVATNCGFEISDDEIRRISTRAETPAQFQAIWENETWWTDKNINKISMADLDTNLLAEIKGDEDKYEAFEAAYDDATVSNQRYHIVFAKDFNRGGVVFVGSGSSGVTEWTDADSADDVLARFIACKMAN